MTITPISGPVGLVPLPPSARPASQPGTDESARSGAAQLARGEAIFSTPSSGFTLVPTEEQKSSVHAGDTRLAVEARTEWEALKEVFSQGRLELRLQTLPKSPDVVIMRFVEPRTGEVVREFPPAALAEALAELRARVAARLDRIV